MGVIAAFKIVDYQGQEHMYYRFGGAHPRERYGVFANFPQGDRDFCLETYVRRLNLEEIDGDYMVDIGYRMDLRSRTIKVSSGCYEDIDFYGTFEDAIRHFAFEEYSQKDALDDYPENSSLMPILVPGFLDGLWEIVDAVQAKIPWLKYDHSSNRLLYIGDNINFYMYRDFIYYPRYIMNECPGISEDAFANARRVGVKFYFKNTISNSFVTLFYMLRVTRDGYILPLTEEFIPYGEGISEETKMEELAMIVMMISERNPTTIRAVNFLYGIHHESDLKRIKDTLRSSVEKEDK